MILVDDREPDSIKSRFSARGAQITRLAYADFAFDGNGPDGPVMIGIERKTVSDLINSIKSGRLSDRQVPGVMQTYDIGCLLIEGEWFTDRDGMVKVGRSRRKTRMRVGALLGYLATVQWVCGMTILRTRNPDDTTNCVFCWAKWWEKPWSQHSSHKAVSSLNMPEDGSVWGPKMNTVSRMAYQISGLGLKRATSAGKVFGSVREMVCAGEEEWREVPGVGKMLAEVAVKTCSKKRG